jgi:hypothetical protein
LGAGNLSPFYWPDSAVVWGGGQGQDRAEKNYVEWMVDNMPEVVRRKTDIKCFLGEQFGSCESKTS